jgi:probable HAF family extracellular repeat protein
MKANRGTIAAFAVGALLMSLLAFTPTATAEVVYTPVNVTISGNGYIKIDLNHDGVKDFVLHSASFTTVCGILGGPALTGSTKINPTTGDGVRVSHLDFAAVLASGISIDASETFYKAQTIVTQYLICWGSSRHVAGYLGLEFQINGQTHYGWAQVDIYAYDNSWRRGMRTTLIGFAYETIPGQAIKTGQTLGAVASVTPLGAPQQAAKRHKYKVIDVGTLGGPTSSYNFGSVIINNRGVVVGAADTSIYDEACGCFVAHAFRWENGALRDLGTLPGGLGSIANAINSKGSIVGISDVLDPVIGHRADAALWTHGQIIDLGTLGGPFAAPNDINDREQIVGGGLNTTPDPFGGLERAPFLGGTTQTRALLWQDGAMQDLGTLGGNDAFAISVNGRGQIAGNSFTNSIPNAETGIPTVHPFIWENGQMVDLGSLGGLFAVASKLNAKGQVAGTSDLAGDQTAHPFVWERGSLRDLGTLGGTFGSGNWLDEAGGVVGGATTKDDQLFRAFRWENGKMTNLGSLNGDQCSVAFGGNSKGQVVGNSLSDCDHETHAFLWENGGPMVDLNSFLPPGSGILLREGVFINERGEIAVDGRLANGDVHAFVLVPDDSSATTVDDVQSSAQIVQSSPAVNHAPVTPENVAAFAARSAHRNRSLGVKPTK